MKLKNKTIILLSLLVSAVILLTGYIMWGNRTIQVTEISVEDADIPAAFDGYRIAQISDLHCAEFGEDNSVLLKMLSDISPDIIVMTGDLYDSRWGDMSVCIDFSKEAAKIAPTYMSSGNHDGFDNADKLFCFSKMKGKLEDAGVTVLSQKRVELYKDGESITLIGVDDIGILCEESFGISYEPKREEKNELMSNEISTLLTENDGYTILLSHRPEYFDVYCACGVNLVFSGHAHGGQFRLPLIGGLYSPGQGIFPKYTSGMYTLDDTDMIVSRGLGNSSFPFRFNNQPQIVVATLKTKSAE